MITKDFFKKMLGFNASDAGSASAGSEHEASKTRRLASTILL